MEIAHVEIDALEKRKNSDKTYDEKVIISIRKDSKFAERINESDLKEPIIIFNNCIFNKVTLSTDDYPWENLKISFNGCFIEDFSTSLIKSKNITLSLTNCLIRNFSGNKQLVKYNLNLRNCIGRYFIGNSNNVNITYSFSEFFPNVWKKILNKFTPYKLKTDFFIDTSNNIKFNSNLFNLNKDEKRGFRTFNNKLVYVPKEDELSLLEINIRAFFESSSIDNYFNIDNLNVNKLNLIGQYLGSIRISNVKVNEILIERFSTKNYFKLFQIEPINNKSIFQINESIFDDAWFDNVQLDKFELVSFFKSSLSNIKFTSTTFPKTSTNFKSFQSLKNIRYPDNKSKFYYKDQYEIFLQLRMSLLQTGNIYEAQKMKRIAYKALIKVGDVDKCDKVILKLNEFTNGHGINPFKAFLLFLLFSIIIYIFYLQSLGLLVGKSINWNLVASYFSFIDITHKSNFLVSKDLLEPLSKILDFANKVVSGYLIYQFISGFRKFGK